MTPYMRGQRAYLDGEPSSKNPYRTTARRLQWAIGWDDARVMEAAKQQRRKRKERLP